MTEANKDLVQELDETLEHFITRAVEKWERQGAIIVDGETLAELKTEPEGAHREGGGSNGS